MKDQEDRSISNVTAKKIMKIQVQISSTHVKRKKKLKHCCVSL